MLIVFIVFPVKCTAISGSHLEGEGRRSSFTYSIRNPLPLPAVSWGRVQLLGELGLRSALLLGCLHGKHWIFMPLGLICLGLATSGVMDATGGQELEPAEGIGSSV